MNNDTIRNTCASCGCPDQLCGIGCGFCGKDVPFPDGTVTKGQANVKEVIGWRAWDVRMQGDKATLRSPVVRAYVWKPGIEWHKAGCTSKPNEHRHDHENIELVPPVIGCGGSPQAHGCGFYAGRTREHLMNMGYNRYSDESPTVIGRVQMQGKIVPASNGWRAGQAKIVQVFVPYEHWQVAKAIENTYHVEVKMDTTMILPKDAAPEWCPKCTAKWEGRVTTCAFCGYHLS